MDNSLTLPQPVRWHSLVYNFLVRTANTRHRLPYRWFWQNVYNRTSEWRNPVQTVIHDRHVRLNFGYTYPFYARFFPSLNDPLLELVFQVFRAKERPIHLVDVGAAIGDTVLLVESNCPDMVSRYLCIDGDPEFSAYLRYNLQHLPNCECILQQLSGQRGEGRSLVRTHAGTASAQGSTPVPVAPFDEVLAKCELLTPDVLKIDVDGFDGEVLSGASDTLTKHKPVVIFEWHPKLCKATGNADDRHFDVLRTSRYNRLVWFTKFGHFSHFGSADDFASITRMSRLALESVADTDMHFDVVALPDDCRIDETKLADLQFARKRLSPW